MGWCSIRLEVEQVEFSLAPSGRYVVSSKMLVLVLVLVLLLVLLVAAGALLAAAALSLLCGQAKEGRTLAHRPGQGKSEREDRKSYGMHACMDSICTLRQGRCH